MKRNLTFLCFLLCFVVLIPSFTLSSTKQPFSNEAVFVLLNETGLPSQSSVIKTIHDTQSEIVLTENITDCEVIDGSAELEFTDQGVTIKRTKGYQGAIVIEYDRYEAFPFQVNLTYRLNGIPATWENIIGKSGIVKFQVHFQSNPSTEESHLPFTIQATVPLNLKQVSIIRPGQADVLTIGNRANLVYSNLMLDSLDWEWEAYSEDWKMDSWDLTFLPKYPNLDLESYLSLIDKPLQAIRQLNDGIRQIREGVEEINQNQALLLKGYQDIGNGWNKWIAGYQQLTEGLTPLYEGFEEYRKGLNRIQTNITSQQALITKELEKWTALQSKLKQAKTGFSLFTTRLTQLKANLENLDVLSSSLSQDLNTQSTLADQVLLTSEKDSPAYQLAKSVKDNQAQLEDIRSVIQDGKEEISFLQTFWETFQKTMNEEYLPMLEEASTQINGFVDGLNALVSGLLELDKGLGEGQQGVKQLQDGAANLEKNTKPLLSPTTLLQSSSTELQTGSKEVANHLVQIERNGTIPLITELTKAQTSFKEIVQLKNETETKFRNSETPFFIVKINFRNHTQNIFERFQEKMRLHYNNG